MSWLPVFPNGLLVVGALLIEQNDEWAVQRARYMTLETFAPPQGRRRAGSGINCAWRPRNAWTDRLWGTDHDRPAEGW